VPGEKENRPSGRLPAGGPGAARKPLPKSSSGTHEALGSGVNDTKSETEKSVPISRLYGQPPPGSGSQMPSPAWVADAIARATTGSPQRPQAPEPPPSRPEPRPALSPFASSSPAFAAPPVAPAAPPPPEAASKRRALPRLVCKDCNIAYSGALPKDQKCIECRGPLVDADPAPALSPRTPDPRNDTVVPSQPAGSPLLWAPGTSKRSELLVTRYMIKDPTADILGSGAKGVVYRAYDRRMGERPVAIKLFFDDADAGDPESKREQTRTEREIRIQALLTHPAIVTAHDRFESPHGSGIVLEYIDGESLEERVKKKGPCLVRDAARIAIEVGRAVEYMHKKGVIHRDLKPANVLLTKDGSVKLIDFGVAKQRDDVSTETDARDPKQVSVRGSVTETGALTREGTIVGTPSYMSPEQAMGRVSFVDERSDVYGVGAILYFAVTGKPPFVGDDVEAILDRVRKLPPPSPSTWNPRVDGPLESIILKTLAKLPEQRFDNAKDFVEQLRRYLEGEQIDPSIYLEPRSQRAVRWAGEHRGFVLGAVGVVLALGLALGTFQFAGRVKATETNQASIQAAGEKLAALDVPGAITLYSQVLKDDPGNSDAQKGLEACYKAQVHVKLHEDGKELLRKALQMQAAGQDAEPVFNEAYYKLHDAKVFGSRAPDLAKELEVAKGVARLDVLPPEGAGKDTRLEIVQLSPDDLSPQQLAIDPPPYLPLKEPLSLPTGLYQATIRGLGFDPISFPVRIARGSDVKIDPVPRAPAGMVYVRAHPMFRPGHPRHDDLQARPVDPFFIDVHEVTVGEYREFLASIGDPARKKRRTPSHWTDAVPEAASVPVTNISFEDASDYAAFRQKELPTEAQWQLAASGGLDDRDYPYGRRFVAAYGLCSGNHADPVATHQHDRSPFGALDMGGNVSELVLGWFDAEGTKRLAKGGSFVKKAPVWERMPVAGPDRSIGFRCVKALR